PGKWECALYHCPFGICQSSEFACHLFSPCSTVVSSCQENIRHCNNNVKWIFGIGLLYKNLSGNKIFVS
ncbi:hypothetical protein, partial [Desulfobacter sp. UBA2225]|uniref:hypothetical protein n=1 Tax=Desulfobacter sp. UBA2225 TaxID=1961413 RepID=UPI00257CEF98